MHHSLLSYSPTVIVELQIFAKTNNAVVNIFVHKAFVSLFLQDCFLKEELMSKCGKTSRVVLCTGKVLSRKIEPVASGET